MRTPLTAIVLLSAGALVALAATEPSGEHKVLTPADINWGAGPASLPQGAQATILYGDPAKEGLFAMRLKFPKGYRIAPHTHPKPEIITVISGTFHIGHGETADPTKAKAVPAGGFVALPPGHAHYAGADEETVVQLNSTGPWSITYINPAHDPRKK